MATQIAHFIDGQRAAGQSQRTVDIYNPSTGEVQAQVAMGSDADIDVAVAVAVEAQKEWAAYNPQRRARVMMKFVELVNENLDRSSPL
jgi:malonate-semialdehyde dehydrogenase (acetylating) / methylmalonate-semialdehyde dehydrogenase